MKLFQRSFPKFLAQKLPVVELSLSTIVNYNFVKQFKKLTPSSDSPQAVRVTRPRTHLIQLNRMTLFGWFLRISRPILLFFAISSHKRSFAGCNQVSRRK